MDGIISVSGWLFERKPITKHGNMNVKVVSVNHSTAFSMLDGLWNKAITRAISNLIYIKSQRDATWQYVYY
jgi:hypothetical protein